MEDDQRFGIGFDKTNLVNKGIRPVVYAESKLAEQIMYLYNYIQDNQISEDENLNVRLSKLIEGTYPLMFPLLEDKSRQGYMWEREWRATNRNGFTFSHKDIKIVCCPEEEEESIRDILGSSASSIQFIRAWREYDDVKSFLEHQKHTWQDYSESLSQAEQEDQKIQKIDEFIQQYHIANNTLKSYQEVIQRLEYDKEKIRSESQNIAQNIENLETQLSEIKQKKAIPNELLDNTELSASDLDELD